MAVSPAVEDVLSAPDAGVAVLRGSALRTLGYLLSVLLSTLSVPLMTRHLGVVDFGRFVTVVSLITLAAGLAEAGLMNIGVREYATREPAEHRRLMRNLIGLRALLTLAGVAGALAFAAAAGYPAVVVAGTAIAGTGLLAGQLQETLTIPYAASLRLGLVTALALVRQVTLVGGIVALVLLGAGLLPFYALSAAASAAALAATILLSRRRLPLAPRFDAAICRPLLRDVIPYAAATAVGAVLLQVTMIATSLLTTVRETGYFATSFRIFEVLIAIGGIVAASAFPVVARAARDDPARFRNLLQRLFELAVIGGIGIALLTAVGAATAIRVIGGRAYEPAVPVLRILSLGIPFSFLAAIWGFALLSLRRHRALLLANGAALVVGACLCLTLIPSGGGAAAAVAVLAAELALAALYGLALTRDRPELRVSIRVVPRALAAAGVATLAVLESSVPNAAGVLEAAVAYCAALAVCGVVPSDLRQWVRHPRVARRVVLPRLTEL